MGRDKGISSGALTVKDRRALIHSPREVPPVCRLGALPRMLLCFGSANWLPRKPRQRIVRLLPRERRPFASGRMPPRAEAGVNSILVNRHGRAHLVSGRVGQRAMRQEPLHLVRADKLPGQLPLRLGVQEEPGRPVRVGARVVESGNTSHRRVQPPADHENIVSGGVARRGVRGDDHATDHIQPLGTGQHARGQVPIASEHPRALQHLERPRNLLQHLEVGVVQAHAIAKVNGPAVQPTRAESRDPSELGPMREPVSDQRVRVRRDPSTSPGGNDASSRRLVRSRAQGIRSHRGPADLARSLNHAVGSGAETLGLLYQYHIGGGLKHDGDFS